MGYNESRWSSVRSLEGRGLMVLTEHLQQFCVRLGRARRSPRSVSWITPHGASRLLQSGESGFTPVYSSGCAGDHRGGLRRWAMAQAYQRMNPDVCYLGIELNPEAAHVASCSGRLDRVIVGDAASVEFLRAWLGRRCAGGRLPDLRRCARTYDRPMERAGPDGRLRSRRRPGPACIPNVQHYSVIVNLLRGELELSG